MVAVLASSRLLVGAGLVVRLRSFAFLGGVLRRLVLAVLGRERHLLVALRPPGSSACSGSRAASATPRSRRGRGAGCRRPGASSLVGVGRRAWGAATVSVMVSSDSSSCAGSEAGTPSAVSQPTARRAMADHDHGHAAGGTRRAGRRDGRTGLLVTGRSASPPAGQAPEGGMLADRPRKASPTRELALTSPARSPAGRVPRARTRERSRRSGSAEGSMGAPRPGVDRQTRAGCGRI